MNSKWYLPFAVILPALGALLVWMGQLPLHRRLHRLEQELGQLRGHVTRQAPAGVPQLAGETGLPGSAGVPLRTAGSSATSTPHSQLAQATDLDRIDALSEDELDRIIAGAGAPLPGPLAAPGTLGPPVEEVVQRPSRRVEKGGVLLAKGRLQVEPTFSYSHISNNRVGLSGFSVFDVIFIGEIRSDEIDRDLYTSSLSMRYGITKNLQGELEVPMQYQREELLSGPLDDRQQTINTRSGFTDVGAGLFYQFAREKGNRPSMIATVRVKAPTGQAPELGSGVWGVKSGLVFLKSSDPVVLFTNLAYTFNFPGDVAGKHINRGDSVEYSAGIAYALNYNLAVNGSFEQIFVGESTSNGDIVKGSRLVVANLKTGLTYAITKNLSVDVSVGTGLTEDSPDLAVTVSFPYTF